MPITVTAASGCLTPEGERAILPALTEALLDASGASGNPFLTAIVGGTVQILDPERVYAGGANHPLVMVELKLPAVALADVERRTAFIEAAIDIVDTATVPGHRREDTWVNIVHASDGGWGVYGRPYTGEELLAGAAASA